MGYIKVTRGPSMKNVDRNTFFINQNHTDTQISDAANVEVGMIGMAGMTFNQVG